MEVCTWTPILASSLKHEGIDHKIQCSTIDACVTAPKLATSKGIVKKATNCITLEAVATSGSAMGDLKAVGGANSRV
jgi:hypothetical protein